MYFAVVIFSLNLLAKALSQYCVGWTASDPTGSQYFYTMNCGRHSNPACKFSAHFVTIDPDRYGAEFGDAYYDTNDIDVELSCEFRPQIKGNYTIAIVRVDDGNIENALNEFNNAINKSNVTIEAEKHGFLENTGSMNTSVIIVSNDLMPGTKYACFCPQVTYVYESERRYGYSYIRPVAVEYNFNYSSSFYQVPAYIPCKQRLCNNDKMKHMQHCYQTNTGKHLKNMHEKQIESLVSYCEEEKRIRNNWITESWKPMINKLLNDYLSFNYDQTEFLRLIVSKAIAQHVCTLMPSVQDWLHTPDAIDLNSWGWGTPLAHKVGLFMNSNQNFSWYLPDGEEIGSLMLLKGYVKKHWQSQELINRGKEHIRCTQHIKLLTTMTKANFGPYDVHKFFAKTYPGCVDTLEPSWEKSSFELLFNDVPAFYDTKHVSFGMNDDILLLKMPHQNSTVKEDKIATTKSYKYERIDCSLYIWNKSEGIQNYHREELYMQQSYDTNSSLIYEYNIPKNKTEKYGDGQKILVGCYIVYDLHSENKISMPFTRVKKMQFYVKPEKLVVVGEYSEDNKQLSGCKIVDHKYSVGTENDGNGTCKCVMKISQCNPLKTTHFLNKTVDCYKDVINPDIGNEAETTSQILQTKRSQSQIPQGNEPQAKSSTPNTSNTALVIFLALFGLLLFITGVVIAVVFNKKRAKIMKPEVRVLTLIQSTSVDADGNFVGDGDISEYFQTEDTSEIPKSQTTSSDARQSQNQPPTYKIDAKK